MLILSKDSGQTAGLTRRGLYQRIFAEWTLISKDKRISHRLYPSKVQTIRILFIFFTDPSLLLPLLFLPFHTLTYVYYPSNYHPRVAGQRLIISPVEYKYVEHGEEMREPGFCDWRPGSALHSARMWLCFTSRMDGWIEWLIGGCMDEWPGVCCRWKKEEVEGKVKVKVTGDARRSARHSGLIANRREEGWKDGVEDGEKAKKESRNWFNLLFDGQLKVELHGGFEASTVATQNSEFFLHSEKMFGKIVGECVDWDGLMTCPGCFPNLCPQFCDTVTSKTSKFSQFFGQMLPVIPLIRRKEEKHKSLPTVFVTIFCCGSGSANWAGHTLLTC